MRPHARLSLGGAIRGPVVHEALGGHDAAEVETVDIGFFDPGD